MSTTDVVTITRAEYAHYCELRSNEQRVLMNFIISPMLMSSCDVAHVAWLEEHEPLQPGAVPPNDPLHRISLHKADFGMDVRRIVETTRHEYSDRRVSVTVGFNSTATELLIYEVTSF